MKKALVESVINQNIMRLVGLLALLCLAGTIGYIVFTVNAVSTHWYLQVRRPRGDTHLRMPTEAYQNTPRMSIRIRVCGHCCAHGDLPFRFDLPFRMRSHAYQYARTWRCAFACAGACIYPSAHAPPQLAPTNFGDVVSRFLTFFLLNANFIPVSLYVSMKISRQAQKIFMELDETCVFVDEKLQKATNGKEGVFPLQVPARPARA